MHTTETNGTISPQFTSMGQSYDTLAAVTARLATLAHDDLLHGPSDGRETERATLMQDLHKYAATQGARTPIEAVGMALDNLRTVHSVTLTPVLSLPEELAIAAHNTNLRIDRGEMTRHP